MKSYIISIVITSILIAITELILPQGKLKSVINTVFSLTLLTVMLTPLKNSEYDYTVPTFGTTTESSIDLTNLNEYYDDRIERYYQDLYKNQLLNNNLVTEKVIVEITNMQIDKIKIFLSNLVIPEENSHINNNVIANYVAEILGVDAKKVEIYA